MLLTQSRAERMLRDLPGTIGLYCRDLGSGETVAVNAEAVVEAASVIKLYVMAEAFRQRAAGEVDFARPVTVRPEDRLPSCGALSYLHPGVTLPVGDLVTLMVILSDNTATNLLIDLLGQERIRATIAGLGMRGTALNRKLFMPELAARGIRNEITAGDCARLLELLWRGEAVDAESSAEMLRILGDQRLNGKMPFHLHSRGIRCAHKTGEDDGITHDVGIIHAATPRIFCFVSERTDVPRAERVLQDLAALCADVEV